MLFGNVEDGLFIALQEDRSDMSVTVEDAHEYPSDKNVQDVVVGIKKHQIPKELYDAYGDETIDAFLHGQPKQIYQGVHGFVTLPHSLLVLVDDKACALRKLSYVVSLSPQVFVQALCVP